MIFKGKLFKSFLVLFIVCFLCVMFWNKEVIDTRQVIDYDEFFYSINDSGDYCNDELFAYRHVSVVGSKRVLQKGQPFHCSKLSYLKKFKLTAQNKIETVALSNYQDDLIFVSASNLLYFHSVKAAFATVRKHFGQKNKFILYDLGGVGTKFKDEIAKMCNLELRTFNFNQLPREVRNIKTFSWKVFILAEVFNEATNIIYLDSSIFFESNQFDAFFDKMASESRLVPFQMSGYTGHSLKFATNPSRIF